MLVVLYKYYSAICIEWYDWFHIWQARKKGYCLGVGKSIKKRRNNKKFIRKWYKRRQQWTINRCKSQDKQDFLFVEIKLYVLNFEMIKTQFERSNVSKIDLLSVYLILLYYDLFLVYINLIQNRSMFSKLIFFPSNVKQIVKIISFTKTFFLSQ